MGIFDKLKEAISEVVVFEDGRLIQADDFRGTKRFRLTVNYDFILDGIHKLEAPNPLYKTANAGSNKPTFKYVSDYTGKQIEFKEHRQNGVVSVNVLVDGLLVGIVNAEPKEKKKMLNGDIDKVYVAIEGGKYKLGTNEEFEASYSGYVYVRFVD